MYGARIAGDALERRRGGLIINTASTASLGPMPADPLYLRTKIAVVNLVQASARLATSHNISVNAILPGMVYTQFIRRTDDGLKPAGWLGRRLRRQQCPRSMLVKARHRLTRLWQDFLILSFKPPIWRFEGIVLALSHQRTTRFSQSGCFSTTVW